MLTYQDSREPQFDRRGYAGGGFGLIRMAFAYWYMIPVIPKTHCYIDAVAVDGNFRGKGIGKVLLDRADFEARKRGCSKIFLMVAENNRAQNLYKRHGYSIMGTLS